MKLWLVQGSIPPEALTLTPVTARDITDGSSEACKQKKTIHQPQLEDAS